MQTTRVIFKQYHAETVRIRTFCNMSATPQYILGSRTNMADIGFDYPLFLRSVMLNYSIAFPAVSCMGPLYWVLHYKVLFFSNLQYSKTICR
jgi:hypothetical protein